ncbi:transmembrane 9 family protein [Pikeienuella piscinae]|uniref:Transmembrane 9 family protein n=1 Tax=Pikeienuella piscinae TaxID=2748098 RepID=A0A7M3T5Z3_9RHOB|nr:transmembrane 9 family protein [Pikeienuella piscinae]QIE57424.1 transmembrane 9 family protein [Pikeienuella piscinae]
MSERIEAPTSAARPALADQGNYVDWSSIFAGAVVASGIAFVFMTFGAALGLSFISPYKGEGSALAALVAVGCWMLWTTISSFMAGGYIAGRMRRRIDSASVDEVSIRDGVHGLTMWGVAVLLGAALLAASANTAVQDAAETTAAATAAQSMATDASSSASDPATASETATTVAAKPELSDAEAKAAAETARKYSILSAFVLASSLLIAGAGAYWAAGVGGRHRDEGRVFTQFGRWA